MVLTIGILTLSVAVLSPFVSPLLLAGVLCYALNPVYTWLVKAASSHGYEKH
jgi:predicted PurR-regulated permease PerM